MLKQDLKLCLNDGTELSTLSEKELLDTRKSCAKLMQVIGRTPHYARKNRSNMDMMREDQHKIDTELLRRKTFHRIDIAGWQGYIEEIIKPAVLEEWKGEVPEMYASDPCLRKLLKVEGKYYRCPADRTPTICQLVDSLYRLTMQMPRNVYVGYGSMIWIQSGCDKDQHIVVRGMLIKTLILMGVAKTEHIPDPLAETAPWTVLDFEPGSD